MEGGVNLIIKKLPPPSCHIICLRLQKSKWEKEEEDVRAIRRRQEKWDGLAQKEERGGSRGEEAWKGVHSKQEEVGRKRRLRCSGKNPTTLQTYKTILSCNVWYSHKCV